MPFYRQVTEIPGRAPQKLAISAISRDDPELLKGTLSKQHVNLDGVYRAPVIDALSSTPIVLIVDETESSGGSSKEGSTHPARRTC